MPTNFWLRDETRGRLAASSRRRSKHQLGPNKVLLAKVLGPAAARRWHCAYMHEITFLAADKSTPLQFKGAFTNRKYFPPPSKKFHVYSERSVFSVQTSQIKSGKKKSGFLTMKGFRPSLWRIGTDILATTHLNLLTSKYQNKKHSSRK